MTTAGNPHPPLLLRIRPNFLVKKSNATKKAFPGPLLVHEPSGLSPWPPILKSNFLWCSCSRRGVRWGADADTREHT